MPTDLNSSSSRNQPHIEPEWIRIPEAVARFGISRAKLYQLAGEGRIRSVSLRDSGQKKATRLFNLQSLREFIESFETAHTRNP